MCAARHRARDVNPADPRTGSLTAQKKGPRKGRVPGGRRTSSFSGSDWTLGNSVSANALAKRHPCQADDVQPGRSSRVQPLHSLCEAYGRLPCQPHQLRGPRKRRRLPASGCGPFHVESCSCSSCRGQTRRFAATLVCLRLLCSAARIRREENMEISLRGQGRFVRRFSRI